MKVTRKFSLNRLGHPYETVDIEVEASNIVEAMREIENAWRTYSRAIEGRTVQ